MAYSTFRKFVNLRFPLIKFKNETLVDRLRNETLEAINLPPNSTSKADTQIVRYLKRTL